MSTHPERPPACWQNATRNWARRTAAFLITQLAATTLLTAADLTTWPGQYYLRPWETNRLTAADVVGPDGIVYPNLTGVGVTGGIPDVNIATNRAGYTIFDVTAYGAAGDGVSDDDAPVAAALAAARASATGTNKTILYFPTGTYLLSDPLTINESNFIVDGDGPANTVLKLQPGNASTAGLITISKPIVYIGYLYPTTLAAHGTNTVAFDKDPAVNGYTVGTWVRMFATQAGTGRTMTDRYSNPDNHVVYNDAMWHFGRMFIAKVTAINSAAKTMTFDRSFVHDYYTDEVPEMRTHPMVEYSGVQDLTIETTSSSVSLSPAQFDRTANSWLKNVHFNKPKNWPMILNYVARFEIRDCVFNGSWTDINQGSVVYLGWIQSTDSLMDNCQGNDQRHMAIFQMANRSVVRGCTFTGTSIQSPQLHGRMPLDNLIEGCTFATRAYGSTSNAPSGRGLSAYASDGAATLIHGIEGPRNVFYNNRVNSGAGFVHLQGISENLIFAYNRVLKTDDIEAYPSIVAMDRTFDTIIRGNIFQTMTYTPFISLEDPTCTGWSVTDNRIYGSNGYLYEGDSDIALAHNNRFFATNASLPAATTPEVASLYAWQLTNANTPRLVLVIDRRTVTDTGGTTEASVTRVKSSGTNALTVTLSPDIAGLSVPASVDIPAGEVRATFTVTGASVSGGEKTVTLTASAAGLLSDTEQVFVLDQDVAQPNFGALKHAGTTDGLPSAWRARSYGQVTATCTQSYNAGTDTWSMTGAGIANETFHGNLYRSGRRFVYQTVEGNGEIRARITGVTGERQVGLMVADDEATSTDFVWVEPTGQVISSSNTNGSPHGRPIIQAAAGTKTVPQWLRIQRTGFVFVVSRSFVTTPASEADWTNIVTFDMYRDSVGTASPNYKSPAVLNQRMHYGLFLNSGSLSTTASATFTGVQITGSVVGSVTPPAAPTGLAAVLVSNTQANLTWTDNATNENSYSVEVKVGSSPTWSVLGILVADTTNYSQSGLLDGITYSYRVRAANTSNGTYSAYSAIASVSPALSTLPTAPSGLSAAGMSSSEVQLLWTDNAYNESGYVIQRSTDAGSGFGTLTVLGANATTYTDTGLPDGTRFYYRVLATNALGSSTPSATAIGITPLIEPDNLAVTAASDTDISLAWSDNTTAETAYALQRSVTSGTGFTEIATVASGATTYTDTTAVNGTTYFYRVLARNSFADSAPSAEVSALAANFLAAEFYEPFSHALSPSSVVGRPGSGTGGSGNWLALAGSAPVDALLTNSLAAGRIPGLGNQLRLSETSSSSRVGLLFSPTVQSVVTPAANTSRTFWVSYIVRTPASFANATPYLGLVTTNNTLVLALYAHTGNNNRRYSLGGNGLTQVNSANNAIAAGSNYCYIAKVTVSDTDGNATNGLELIEARLWQYPAGTLPPTAEPVSGGLYRSATAVSSRLIGRLELSGGSSSASSRFIFDEVRLGASYAQVALPPPPAAPSALTFSGTTSSATTLLWADNATDETGYKVQRAGSAGGPFTNLATLAANSSNYTDTGLTFATTYYYRVRATNSFGDSAAATGSVTTAGYTISGTVTLSSTGLAGVTISDGTRQAVTGSNGVYLIAGVPAGNYTLTPSLGAYSFTPSNRAVSVTVASLTAQDFVALPPVPVIPSGQTATGAVGSVFTYQITASNGPVSYALAGGTLPPGISLNTTSGQLTGTPTQSGVYSPSITAANTGGTSTAVSVTCVINDPALLVYEGFRYSLGMTNTDPDSGLNSNNGLPNSNVGGTPSGTGVGLYGSYGGDHTVVAGLAYADAGGTLATSGNALRRTTGTGFSAAMVRGYRRMSSDPFAAYRAVATNDTFGWNGVASNQLFFSVLLSVSATNTGTDNRLVVNLGLDGSSWNVYLSHANGTAKWRYGDQAGTGADLGTTVTNQPVLIVARLSFVSATNFATAYWFNPPLGQPLGAPTFAKTYATTNTGGQFNGIQTRDGSNIITYDEFRLGTTFAAVTPHTAYLTGLQQFRAAYNLASNGSDDLLAPAGDGVANLAKFAFNLMGTGPGQASALGTANAATLSPSGTAGLPLVGLDGSGRLTITYIRRKAASLPGITYQVEFSNDLVTWAVNPSATEGASSLDATFERVTVSDSLLPDTRFARVRVTVP